jgi:hypothetical protein
MPPRAPICANCPLGDGPPYADGLAVCMYGKEGPSLDAGRTQIDYSFSCGKVKRQRGFEPFATDSLISLRGLAEQPTGCLWKVRFGSAG